jgi:hypothetical protein
MLWDKPDHPPRWPFYVGLILAAVGAALVLAFKPEEHTQPTPPTKPAATSTTPITSPPQST